VALGELTAYVLLAIVVGIGVAIVAALAAAADVSPVLGGFLIALAAVAYIYGVVWTVRSRPGLYLENLVEEMRDEARSARVGSGAWRRSRMLAMIWVQVTTVAAVGYVFFWIAFRGN
jgi:hypothetical protein